jgi:Co/Zn/Cd efflux system component
MIMGASCCGNGFDLKIKEVNKNFKRALWIALILNFSMFVFSSKWPDLIVAIFIAYLSVTASYKVLLVVKDELKEAKALQKV